MGIDEWGGAAVSDRHVEWQVCTATVRSHCVRARCVLECGRPGWTAGTRVSHSLCGNERALTVGILLLGRPGCTAMQLAKLGAVEGSKLHRNPFAVPEREKGSSEEVHRQRWHKLATCVLMRSHPHQVTVPCVVGGR